MHEWVRICLELQAVENQVKELIASRENLKRKRDAAFEQIRRRASETGKLFEQIIREEE